MSGPLVVSAKGVESEGLLTCHGRPGHLPSRPQAVVQGDGQAQINSVGLSSPPCPQPVPKGRPSRPHPSPHIPCLCPGGAPPAAEHSSTRVSLAWLPSSAAPQPLLSQAGMGSGDPACPGVLSPGGSPLATSRTATGPRHSLAQALPSASAQGCFTLEPRPKVLPRRPSQSSSPAAPRFVPCLIVSASCLHSTTTA